MAINVFGVDSDQVMKYLPRWSVSNQTLPGDTDMTHWIEVAAAEVYDALIEGGFTVASITAEDAPNAYKTVQHVVARRAAYHYVLANSNMNISDPNVKEIYVKSMHFLNDFKSGKRICEISVAEGKQSGVFYHGTTSDADMVSERLDWTDEL